MKQEFSNKWKSSKQPRKQRKYLANAPLHIKQKQLSGNLSKELRKKYSKRSFQIKKGDNVKIMRGKFKGKSGKINNVDLKMSRISVDGIQRQKKDGSKTNVYFNPSKLQIQELNLSDKKREQALTNQRKKQGKASKLKNKEDKDKKSLKKQEENAPKKK